MKYRSTLVPVLLVACAQAPVIQSSEEPVPAPDYTESELAALAASEAVQHNLEPFGQVPKRDASQYVRMADGVQIAVNLYFPTNFDRDNTRAPTVYAETWYTRGQEGRGQAIALYQRAGYVVVVADPRGLGASFGSQSSYLTQAQRNDEREILAWIAEQSWSNGRVAAIGASVSAMLAEAVLASGAPSLHAGIVRATEWDQYSQNLFPGGIPNTRIQALITGVLMDMRGVPCLQDTSNCEMYGPVDGDENFVQLRAALREHQQNITGAALEGVLFQDDVVGDEDFSAVSPSGHARELAEQAVPTRVPASWMDGATAQGALQRFLALPDMPMHLSLGATTHLAGLNADPFEREAFQPARIAPEDEFGADIDFITRVLDHKPIERQIDYYVLGANTWKSTAQWPPRDVREVTLHFSESSLEARSSRTTGEREYRVDPETSSGTHNRWASQMNQPIYYGDRRHAPGVRASFDAAPVPSDVELVGSPELCLTMRSDQRDGAVYAYLEDVAPDGRVTYLSEGLLRLLHRGGGCDSSPGTVRSFKHADAQEVVPNELMQVEIPLLPLAARIQKGHHLRVSLAGADKDNFPMLSEVPATWQIAYGGSQGSTLRIPVRPWH